MKQLYSFSIRSHATTLCCGKKVCKPDFSFLVYQSLYCHANITKPEEDITPFSPRDYTVNENCFLSLEISCNYHRCGYYHSSPH